MVERVASVAGRTDDLDGRLMREGARDDTPHDHRVVDHHHARDGYGERLGHADQISIPRSCSFSKIDSLVKGFITYSSAPDASACAICGTSVSVVTMTIRAVER